MRSLVLLAFALLASASIISAASSTVNADNIDRELQLQAKFNAFQAKFNKRYETVQLESYRYDIFKANLRRIDALNAKNGEVAFGVNQFTDMDPREFAEQYLTAKIPFGASALEQMNLPVTDVEHVPVAPVVFDWRKKNAVTPVKDQGMCGSCWAFSVVETVESAWILAKQPHNPVVELSPQQVVSCDVNGEDEGCNGGWPYDAYAYILKAGGLEAESSYPYTSGSTGQDGKCTFDSSKIAVRMSNFTYATEPCQPNAACKAQDENKMAANMLKHGPASVCLDASAFQSYTGGIIRAGSGCFSEFNAINHCVQAVGVGQSGADTYWVLRNSWSESWGEQGYAKVEYGKNVCGVANLATLVHI